MNKYVTNCIHILIERNGYETPQMYRICCEFVRFFGRRPSNVNFGISVGSLDVFRALITISLYELWCIQEYNWC